MEDCKFTKIAVLNEDAERLELHSERVGMDQSEIIHRLLYWYDLFLEAEEHRETNMEVTDG